MCYLAFHAVRLYSCMLCLLDPASIGYEILETNTLDSTKDGKIPRDIGFYYLKPRKESIPYSVLGLVTSLLVYDLAIKHVSGWIFILTNEYS